MRNFAAAALALMLVAIGGAQSTASLSGRAVDDDDGAAVRNARVGLIGPSASRAVLTDADGRFSLEAPGGARTISIRKTGFATATATLTAGLPAVVRLERGNVVTGRVVDEFGEPILLARVAAEPADIRAANAPTLATAITDDRGDYRLTGLRRGAVRIAVMVETFLALSGAQRPRARKIYFPGTETADEAASLTLNGGEARDRIDFVVQAADFPLEPVGGGVMLVMPPGNPIEGKNGILPTAVVRGRVLSSDLRALPAAQVRLSVWNDARQSVTVRSDNGGRFEFSAIPGGRYRINAAKVGYAAAASTKDRPIEVGEGTIRDDIDVTLTRWGSINGHIFDENEEPLQAATLQLMAVRYGRWPPAAGPRALGPAEVDRQRRVPGLQRAAGPLYRERERQRRRRRGFAGLRAHVTSQP